LFRSLTASHFIAEPFFLDVDMTPFQDLDYRLTEIDFDGSHVLL